MLCVLVLGLSGGEARAQGADQATRDAARTLGQAGVEAYEANDFAGASEKLEKAFAVLKVTTIGVWSARALVKLGKWVAASERYREVARLGVVGGDTALQKQAQSEAAAELEALLARLPKVVIQLEGAPPSQVQLSIDGQVIPTPAPGESRLLDPGEHSVEGAYAEQRVKVAISAVEGKAATALLRFEPTAPAATASGPQAPSQPARPAALPPERDPAAKQVSFSVEGAQVWDLKQSDGKLLCRLPCQHWIEPRTAALLARADDDDSLQLPGLGLMGSKEPSVTVKPSRGSPIIAGVSTVVLAIFSVSMFGAAANPERNLDPGETVAGQRTFYLVTGGVFAALTGGAGYWWYWSRSSSKLEVR